MGEKRDQKEGTKKMKGGGEEAGMDRIKEGQGASDPLFRSCPVLTTADQYLSILRLGEKPEEKKN